MDADHQKFVHPDPARLEKQIDSDHASTAPSLRHADIPPGRAPQAISTHRKFLSEEEALQHARENPDDEAPVYLTYSFNDGDNPRNWPKWKKWYITCFVSMLNVLTYVTSTAIYIRDLTAVLITGEEQLPLCWWVQLGEGTAHIQLRCVL